MPRVSAHDSIASANPPQSATAPSDALPAWMTPALITLTQKAWEPFYGEPISLDTAVRILRTVGRVIESLCGRDEK